MSMVRFLVRDHPGMVRPEVLSLLSSDETAYRYLEPGDLAPPWTPELLTRIAGAKTIAGAYAHWRDEGEGIYRALLSDLEAKGLQDWVPGVLKHRARFRKRVQWLALETPWVPFQVDGGGVFLDVTSPDVWQVVVDTVREEFPRWRDFLGRMRMGDLDYIKAKIPGPHGDKSRLAVPGMVLGYGVSTTIPTFGYRREHRSEVRLAGWSAATQKLDLFGEAWD